MRILVYYLGYTYFMFYVISFYKVLLALKKKRGSNAVLYEVRHPT